MMKPEIFTAQQRRAAEICLSHNMPFALFALPGEGMQFVASRPSEDEGRNEWDPKNHSWEGFIINFFGNDEDYVAGVRNEFDDHTVVNFLNQNPAPFAPSLIESPSNESTGRIKYLSMATSIISRLKREGGKTVFSRVIVDLKEGSVIDTAEAYLSMFPDTFRYLCFTQETGLWFGATPELLATYTPSTKWLDTVALAGTMPIDSTVSWSTKNIAEHTFVVTYLLERLEELGADEIKLDKIDELKFGKVKHLLTRIRAHLPVKNPRGLLYALSPTPALAGVPRDKAISEIILCETHSRLCYGGFVGAVNKKNLSAFANLRCATVRRDSESNPDLWTYYVFAGGGLTAKSKPEDEWDEGQAKTFPLRKAINPEITI